MLSLRPPTEGEDLAVPQASAEGAKDPEGVPLPAEGAPKKGAEPAGEATSETATTEALLASGTSSWDPDCESSSDPLGCCPSGWYEVLLGNGNDTAQVLQGYVCVGARDGSDVV